MVQYLAQAVCNMGKVGQGQRVGRVETCNGYFQGIDSVDAPRTSLRRPGEPRRAGYTAFSVFPFLRSGVICA